MPPRDTNSTPLAHTMNNILTCTDGSNYSQSVYELSAWAANRTGASIHVLHMLDHHRGQATATDLTGNIGIDTGSALLEELTDFEEKKSRIARLRGKAIGDDAKQKLKGAGVEKVTTELRHGALVDQIEEIERSADLLVIGKRGNSAGQAKSHLGSNLERVLRSSIRPVLVAPEAILPVETFLLAYDGGPSSEKAVQFAIEQDLLKGLKCLLLRAGKLDSNAEWFLHETAGKLRSAGYDVETQVSPGSPAEVIAQNLADGAVQLLLMGAYGHSKIRSFMMGSTTTTVLLNSHAPVLMFR